MSIKKGILPGRTFMSALCFLFMFILTVPAIMATEPDMGDDKYGGWRWIRLEPPEISGNEAYVVGVTPNYYSDRNKGSYNKFTTERTSFTHKCFWKDWVGRPSEVLQADVTMKAEFKEPPLILVPEDKIPLWAEVSATGSSPGRGTGIIFEYRAKGVSLKDTTQVSTGSGENPPFRKKSIWPYFYTPVPGANGGKISITALLWNTPCSVTWTYEARRFSGTMARGMIIEPRGTVQHYLGAFKEWKGPLRGETQVYTGDRVRTGPNSSCRIVFTNRAGLQDTISIGSDTLVEIPMIPGTEPRLSITAQIWRGIIKIKKAIFREPPTEEELLDRNPFIIRTPTISTGVRGTEFILKVRDEGISEVYLKEGAVEITNLKMNQITMLTAGQSMAVGPDGEEERGAMTVELWDALIDSHFPGETVKRSDFDIPALKAVVTDLKFYESAFDEIDFDKREYNTQFRQSNCRFINWELDLDFPDPGRPINFEITAVWQDPDGGVLIRQLKACRIEAGWTSSYHNIGWGWREPGNWDPGTYRVDLFVEGQKVAGGSFKIFQ